MPSLEALESRIAPAALTILHPLPDLVAGPGQTSASLDLGNLFDESGTFHTFVTIHTNFDADPVKAGQQGDITLELFDDTAPLTVQNFLSYVNSVNKKIEYNGTIFNRLVPGFVLQGGEFRPDLTDSTKLPPVHNEFGASNLQGTVAMARTAVDPNSATDAFFFNLADNPGLDAQNGGFTVFAKVADADSMAVVNAIAALTPQNLAPGDANSAFTSVPTQGGYTATGDTPAKPAPSQLIAIDSISVTPPTHGNNPKAGFTYAVSVTDEAGHATSLITDKLSDDTLSLAFHHGSTGVAKVAVTAFDGTGGMATDSFLVTIKPNLAVTVADNLFKSMVPGDRGKATVHVANNTGGMAAGRFDVKLYLSTTDDLANGVAGAEIGSLANIPLSIASGGSRDVRVPVEVTEQLVNDQGAENYVISAKVTPAPGSSFSELYTDDDANDTHVSHAIYNAFGNFSTPTGFRAHTPLVYVDDAGHKVTITLSGKAGLGQVNPGPAGTAPDLLLRGTVGSSTLLVRTSGGHTIFDNVTVDQPGVAGAAARSLGTVQMGLVDITGDFYADGGLKSLALGDLGSTGGTSHVLHLGFYSENATQKATVSLGNVTDYNFESNEPVASLRALNWYDVNDGTERVASRYMDRFSIAGTFEADFATLGSAVMRTFTVGGALHNSNVQLGGSLGAATLGSIDGSEFLAGTPTVPASLNDFSSVAQIGSFTVRGTLGAGSQIASVLIGRISVGSLDLTGSMARFGFTADAIGTYAREGVMLQNLTSGIFDSQGDSTSTPPKNYQLTVL